MNIKPSRIYENVRRVIAFFTLFFFLISQLPVITYAEEAGNAQFPPPSPDNVVSAAYQKQVSPDESVTIEFKSVRLELPKGAVKTKTSITIEELSSVETLNDGMENVTSGAAGYRFKPDGFKFEKNIKVTLPFDRGQVRSQTDLENLYSYFYNKKQGYWERLEKLSVDENKGVITSFTNHFTDMINSTLKLPESPKPLSFNPTSIKDIKAANPLTNIPQLKPPEANAFGAATFSLPLTLPPGRNGLAPQLALTYNSNTTNGWLGVGFGLTASEITTDTSFGLPNYDGKDTYLLDDMELVPTEQIGADTLYRPRVEAAFAKIVRKGADKDSYFFEVTGKNGIKTVYGKDDACLNGGKGIYKWFIKEVSDVFGNTITYHYQKVDNRTYLSDIIYTGHISEPVDTYRVEFVNEEQARGDVVIDCRGKFIDKLTRRLAIINIYFKTTLIRSYKFSYDYNHFGKSNLLSVTELDGSGNKFYSYSFSYFPMPKTDENYSGFGVAEKIRVTGDTNSSLYRSHNYSFGSSCYVGVGPGYGYTGYNFSGGGSAGVGMDFSYSDLLFMDINGDGLPDLVHQPAFSQALSCQLNQFGSLGLTEFKEQSFAGLHGALNYSSQVNVEVGTCGSFGPASGGIGATFSWVDGKSAFIDLNGDGFLDFIPKGSTDSYLINKDGERFTTQQLIASTSQTPAITQTNAETAELATRFHLVDALKKWRAYHSGEICIQTEAIRKIDNTVDKSDGVKLNLYHNNENVWHNNTNPGDWAPLVADPAERGRSILLKEGDGYATTASHNDTLSVAQGDRIYFKVSSLDKVENDTVAWEPEISYKTISYHEFMGEYFCGYPLKVLTVGEYQALLATLASEDKDWFSRSYTAVYEEANGFSTLSSYRLNSTLTEEDKDTLQAFYAQNGYVIPEKIEQDVLKNKILPALSKENTSGETDFQFVQRLYIKGIYKDNYHYLDDSVTENEKERLVRILKPVNYLSALKYYKYTYNGNKYLVLKSGNRFFIELPSYGNSQLPGIVLPEEQADQIGEVSEAGVLVELIKKDNGETVKKWLKVGADIISLTIQGKAGTTTLIAGESEGFSAQQAGDTITAKEEGPQTEKTYNLTLSSNLPLQIEANIYEALYRDQLSLPLAKAAFDNILAALSAPEEQEFFTGCYTPVIDSEEQVTHYQLLPGLNDIQKLHLLGILFKTRYYKECYSQQDSFYNLKSGLSASDIKQCKDILTSAGILIYSGIEKQMRVYSDASYPVTKVPFIQGINEEEVLCKALENNASQHSTSFITLEELNEEGITVEQRAYIHVFEAANDFTLDNLVNNQVKLIKQFSEAEFNRNLSLLADKEGTQEVNGTTQQVVANKDRSFFVSMYTKSGSNYLLNEELLGKVYQETDKDQVTNKDKLLSILASLGYGKEYFAGGQYNWFYGEWNGNLSWDEKKIGVTDENLPYFYFNAYAPMTAGYSRTEEGITYQNKLKIDLWRGTEHSYTERILTDSGEVEDIERYYLSYTSATVFSPTRMGGDSKERLPSSSSSNSSGSFDGAINKSYSVSANYNAGVVPFTNHGNLATSTCQKDLFDINGDLYPDQITESNGTLKIRYNEKGTGFTDSKDLGGTLPEIRKTVSDSLGVGIYLSSALGGSWQKINLKSDGKVKSAAPAKAEYGAGVNGSIGASKVVIDWTDINGDGLLDQVQNSATGMVVKLNVGDHFESITYPSPAWTDSLYFSSAAPASWEDSNVVRHDTTTSGGFNLGAGTTYINGSAAIGITSTKTKVDLIDMNGDGLPDQVFKVNGAPFKIKFNTGSSFTKEVSWESTPGWNGTDLKEVNGRLLADSLSELQAKNGSASVSYPSSSQLSASYGASSLASYEKDINLFGIDEVLNYSGSFSVSISVTGTIPVQLGILPIALYISPSGNFAYGQSSTDLRLVDFDGDGLPDYVLKLGGENSLQVKLNNGRKVGLLKTITTPEGGRIELDYRKSENTVANPHAFFTLSSVTQYSGVEKTETGEEKGYTYAYDYHGGKYSREEREFFGFDEVRTTQPDGSLIVKTYYNNSYAERGILKSAALLYKSGSELSLTEQFYSFPVLAERNGVQVVFPKLTQTLTTLRDPETGECMKSSIEYTEYDPYGNVKKVIDRGNPDKDEDDIYTCISYQYESDFNIFDSPSELVVTKDGWNGSLLRKRAGSYEKGKLMSQETYLDAATKAVTNFKYDKYGNLELVTDPKGYFTSYSYEEVLHTYVSMVEDRFGYTSSATYDYLFGVEATQTDINNHTIEYKYDSFGRPAKVITGYDSEIPAVEFIYYASEFPARAVTKNKIHYDSADSETLDTVIITDGLRRILQTKKEGEVLVTGDITPSYGMNISGAVSYDEMGRIKRQYAPAFQKLSGSEPDYFYYKDEEEKKSGYYTQTIYDTFGRVVDKILPDKNIIHNAYRITGGELETTVTDPNNKTKISYTNIRENLTRIEEFNRGKQLTTAYKYNLLGEITKITDAKGNVTDITYDLGGRRTSIDNPDAGFIEYKYDINSNLTKKIDGNLRAERKAINYLYDYNRLTEIQYPNSPSVKYYYGDKSASFNRRGRVYRIEDGSGIKEVFFGPLGEEERVVQTFNRLKASSAPITFESAYCYDYLGRIESITYPDQEKLTYSYNRGGQIYQVQGVQQGTTFDYVKKLYYDEYGQRVYIQYGNDVGTTYHYDDARRWLKGLESQNAYGVKFQDVSYAFDAVGNIRSVENKGSFTSTQAYDYDDLYQLTHAEGTHTKTYPLTVTTHYSQDFDFDEIGNIKEKISSQGTNMGTQNGLLNYRLNYLYSGKRPHAASSIGDTNYYYDANGNLVKKTLASETEDTGHAETGKIGLTNPNATEGEKNSSGWLVHRPAEEKEEAAGESQSLPGEEGSVPVDITHPPTETVKNETEYTWDEENWLKKAVVNDEAVEFLYDATGNRTIKKSKAGETVYVNPFFQVQLGNPGLGQIITKHFFIGESRFASKLSLYDDENNIGFQQHNTYFYHSDHLGSVTFITDFEGEIHEHFEYTPYGETWVTQENDTYSSPIRFTGKTLDAETNLYYYGARYLDPRTSRWLSVDPAFVDYLPSGDKEQDKYLPGSGGVFNTINLSLYCYSVNNPVTYKDPDGRVVPAVVYAVMAYLSALGSSPDTTQDMNMLAMDFANGDWAGVTGDVIGLLIPGFSAALSRGGTKLATKFVAEYGDEFAELVAKYGDDALKFVSKYGDDAYEALFRAGNSNTLRKALYEAGEKGIGAGLDAAHHIVAGGSKWAEQTRGILKKFGIGINEAVNGVFLETKYHQSLHTKKYYEKVYDLLSTANTREQAIKILNNIADKLKKGTF